MGSLPKSMLLVNSDTTSNHSVPDDIGFVALVTHMVNFLRPIFWTVLPSANMLVRLEQGSNALVLLVCTTAY